MKPVIWAMTLSAALAGAAAAEEVSLGTGAKLRLLDKMNGRVRDFDMKTGEVVKVGRMSIALGECRYPEGNPAGDAYAFVGVMEVDKADPDFLGWMVASSPALNALDHPRYDVWVMRCITP